MKMSYIVGIIIVVVVVIGGIFWYMQQSGATVSTADQSQTTAQPTTTTTLALGTSGTLGNYLAAGTSGMTLYTYASDQLGVSNCTDTCATTWLPYLVSSADGLSVADGITGTVGTLTRADGTLQVTYNGMPVYFYSQDVKPGDTTGDGVGGLWNVAKP